MIYFMLGLMCGALLALLYIDGDQRPPRYYNTEGTMLTTCIIIAAWTTGMPLWASITTTVIASIRFVFKCIGTGIKLSDK